MIIDRGRDFPADIYAALVKYGEQMWLFRDRDDGLTTRVLNLYQGEQSQSVWLTWDFWPFLISSRLQYLTPRVRITPRDLDGTKLSRPRAVHFICSPLRAAVIMSQVREIEDWDPVTIYEPVPVCISAFYYVVMPTFALQYSCIPNELPALICVLPDITVFR